VGAHGDGVEAEFDNPDGIQLLGEALQSLDVAIVQ